MAAAAGELQPPQAIELVDPLRVATYAQWYTDAMHDPYHNDYVPILQSFIVGLNINIQPAQLLKQVLGSMQIPQAFLILANHATIRY